MLSKVLKCCGDFYFQIRETSEETQTRFEASRESVQKIENKLKPITVMFFTQYCSIVHDDN